MAWLKGQRGQTESRPRSAGVNAGLYNARGPPVLARAAASARGRAAARCARR